MSDKYKSRVSLFLMCFSGGVIAYVMQGYNIAAFSHDWWKYVIIGNVLSCVLVSKFTNKWIR